jgi:hypothetical protein
VLTLEIGTQERVSAWQKRQGHAPTFRARQARRTVVAQSNHRVIHPPVAFLIVAAVIVLTLVVSLAIVISFGSSVTPVAPTLPDPVDRPLFVMAPAGLDLHLVQEV